MDTASEIRLQAINPVLAEKVRLVDAEFQREMDDHLEVVQGLRSYADQLAIWLKGRDPNGNVIDEAAVVTKAPPGFSWHELGLAVDVVPRSLLPVHGWNPYSVLWTVVAKIGASYGLDCGACWHHPDRPHLQLTGRFPVTPTDEAREFFKTGGLFAVWDAAEING